MIWRTLDSMGPDQTEDSAEAKKEKEDTAHQQKGHKEEKLEGKLKDAPEMKNDKDYSLDVFKNDKERAKLLHPEAGDRYAPAELNKDHYNPKANGSYDSNPGQVYSSHHSGHSHDEDDMLDRLGIGGYKANQYHS